MNDYILPYLFEHAPIRIQAVRMTSAWRELHQSHALEDGIVHTLGRAVAATAMLATTIKFDGRISVQLQSQGPLQLLLCQATHDLGIRGMARLAPNQTLPATRHSDSMAGLVEQGHIAVTIENYRDDKRYQGITPVVENSLAQSFEHYFEQSEQLPTRLWLAADEKTAAGLMIRRMPGALETNDDTWNRTQHLAETIDPAELLEYTPEQLVHRLFHQEDLRQLEPRALHFKCNCSRQRVAAMLVSLGREEVDATLADQGKVEVTCDFCGRSYTYDDVDAAALFRADAGAPGPELLQ